MTRNEKKELFLSILENWFDENSGKINTENCIEFYNFFLDCLDFEKKFCPEYEEGFHKFLALVIDVLTEFHLYSDYNISSKEGLKEIVMVESYRDINPEKLDTFIEYLKELFLISRSEHI